jgi:hypothetical protein
MSVKAALERLGFGPCCQGLEALRRSTDGDEGPAHHPYPESWLESHAEMFRVGAEFEQELTDERWRWAQESGFARMRAALATIAPATFDGRVFDRTNRSHGSTAAGTCCTTSVRRCDWPGPRVEKRSGADAFPGPRQC